MSSGIFNLPLCIIQTVPHKIRKNFMLLNNSGFSDTILGRYGIEYHMYKSVISSDAGISVTLGRKYLEQSDNIVAAGIKIKMW